MGVSFLGLLQLTATDAASRIRVMAVLFSIAGPWAKPERNTPSGLIRLSASESSFMLLIRHVMPRFLKDNPQIHIECVADTCHRHC
ncbi:hypothetical protein ALP50_05496, partial [Pseudomonas syringae pv. spinaceae]